MSAISNHFFILHYRPWFWKCWNKGTCPSSNESRGSVFFLASFLMKIFSILTNAPPAPVVRPTAGSMGEEMVWHYYNWSEGDRGQIGDILIPLSLVPALNTYRDVTLGCVQPSGSCLENGEINEIRHKERSAECWRRERQTMETLLELSPYPVPGYVLS